MKAEENFTQGLEKDIGQCIRCGFCQAVCPVYETTFRPAHSARGRMLLLKEVMEGTIPPLKELADPFYNCTTCQACTYSCPAQIKVAQVVEGTRKKLYEAGYTPAPLLGMKDNILQTGNVFAGARKERIELYPPRLKEKAQKGELKARAETLLFMGCVPSYGDLKIVPSLVETLEAGAVDYTTLAMEEVCCGFPLYLMGAGEFEIHGKKIIQQIQATEARELVTPCAGCYKTFTQLYPKIGDLGLKVYHSVQYLDRLIGDGRIQLKGQGPRTVTYQDPCDLGRSLGIFEEPRNILKNVPDFILVEMTRNRLQARCCGGGGGLQADNPGVAHQMAARRVKDALAVGAELLVCACAACKNNLKKGARMLPKGERNRIKIVDITEVAAESMA